MKINTLAITFRCYLLPALRPIKDGKSAAMWSGPLKECKHPLRAPPHIMLKTQEDMKKRIFYTFKLKNIVEAGV
jgi:hypothetical protein